MGALRYDDRALKAKRESITKASRSRATVCVYELLVCCNLGSNACDDPGEGTNFENSWVLPLPFPSSGIRANRIALVLDFLDRYVICVA